MTEHLTEQELIDYAYDLAPEQAMQSARAHLAGCELCWGRLDVLKRKFAALDLLRDEIKPSPELIERAAQAAVTPVAGTITLSRYRFWLSGLAATIVIGCTLLLISNNNPTQRAETKYFAKDIAAVPEPSLTDTPTSDQTPTLAMGIRGGGTVATESLSTVAPVAQTAKPAALAAKARVADVVEPPPFAPASAIELVMLPRRENVQLTIYNSADLTLVREKRNLTLKRGWNWLQFMWANTLIDPTSLSLEPLEQKDRVGVQQLVFPPRLKELGRWLIHSDVSGQVPFELTYFTSGLAWRAFYMGTLAQDEKTIRLESYVRVDNHSGEEYENAQTRLIVGRIHLLDQIAELAQRQYPYGSPEGVRSELGLVRNRLLGEVQLQKDKKVEREQLADAMEVLEAPKEIQKEGLSEYFLYTIEGTETIPDQWGKRLMSFKTDDIPVKNLYKYDEERYGDEAVRFLSFKNDTEHKLGTTPIPDGMVRIYGQTDQQKHLAYVGGTDIKYIPVGEEVELDLGPAQLVKIEPKLMEERTTSYLFDSHGNVAGWDEIGTWKIEATNASTLPIDVEITRGFDEPSWELTTSGSAAAYEKYDVTHARFKLSIEPRSKRTFGYTVTQYRGTRSEYYSSKQQERRP
jgi:hypothetical protein